MTKTNKSPSYLEMEEYFSPGFKASSLLLVGSQTHEIWKDSAKLQAPEDFYLAGVNGNHVAIVRNIDSQYISYFSSLVESQKIINLSGVDASSYLSKIILEHPFALKKIRSLINNDYRLLPFNITKLEHKIAKNLGLSIHGSQKINNIFGTKSGVRKLANLAHIPLSPGYVCTTIDDIQLAINRLHKKFEYVAIKHDTSVSGFLSMKFNPKDVQLLDTLLTSMLNRKFIDGKDTIVVEGWVNNTISIGAHIEILPNSQPIICSAWQQIIDSDNISYIGAGPLSITSKALKNLMRELEKLAKILAKLGAVGSFGPDFLITSSEEKNFEPDSAILIELNTRIPYTAFPLEIVKTVKGTVGSGFLSTHINVKQKITIADVFQSLSQANLLITHKDRTATGVVPFGISMLPWNSFNIVAMANTWDETQDIVKKVQSLFQK